MDAFRLAVAELGEAPAPKLSSFIERRFGIRIEPKFIPIFRASLLDLESLGRSKRIDTPQKRFPELSSGSQRFKEVRSLASELMAKHGLHRWRFAFNRRKQSMGLCVHHRRAIELSLYFVERNGTEEILDTILHEIAHALVGSGHGHDKVWKRKCIEIGARPMRCGEADMPEGRWHARCGGCGKSFDRHRKPKRVRGWFCRGCGPKCGKLMWRTCGKVNDMDLSSRRDGPLKKTQN
jgi:predicted SprT family Zn-dependent metalloprotease